MDARGATEFKTDKYNVLLPTQHIEQVSPWHAARTTIVQVSPDTTAGDVFKVGSRYNDKTKDYENIFCLAKPALMRIAAAAGIVWNWRECGPTTIQQDYVCYKAVGAVRLPDGSWQPIMAEKEIDLMVIEEETHEANLRKAYEYAGDPKKEKNLRGLRPEEWARQQTRSVMLQWRKNKLMRAETGAMLRVIRAALGIKSQYTAKELEKPFVVPRIDFSPDYNDPVVRQALIQHGVSAMSALFGSAGPSSPAFAAHPAIAAPVYDDDTPDVSAVPVRPEPRTVLHEDKPQDDPEAPEVPEAPEDPHGESDLLDDTSSSDGTLFPSEPDPEPEPEPSQSPQKQAAVGTCADCGTGITSASVVNYSNRKFGRTLCYKCQGKAKGAAVNA